MQTELQELKAKAEKYKSLESKVETLAGMKEKLRVETEKAADLEKQLRANETKLSAALSQAQELPQCHEIIRDKSLEIAELRTQMQQMHEEVKSASAPLELLQSRNA